MSRGDAEKPCKWSEIFLCGTILNQYPGPHQLHDLQRLRALRHRCVADNVACGHTRGNSGETSENRTGETRITILHAQLTRWHDSAGRDLRALKSIVTCSCISENPKTSPDATCGSASKEWLALVAADSRAAVLRNHMVC